MIMFFFAMNQGGEMLDFELTMDTSIDTAQYAVGNPVNIYINASLEHGDYLREKYGSRVHLLKNYDLSSETIVSYSADLNFKVKEIKHCLSEYSQYSGSVNEIMVQIILVPASPEDELILLDLAADRKERRMAGV